MNTAFKRAGGRMLDAKVGFFYANHMQTLHKVTCFLISLSYLLRCSDTVKDQGTRKQILIILTHRNLILRKIHLNQLKSD